MSKKKKVKPRRRTLVTPPARPAGPQAGEAAPDPRLQRMSRTATVAGIAAFALALAMQYKFVALDLGANGPTILKVAGVALLIAGYVFSRAARRS